MVTFVNQAESILRFFFSLSKIRVRNNTGNNVAVCGCYALVGTRDVGSKRMQQKFHLYTGSKFNHACCVAIIESVLCKHLEH